MLTSPLLAPLIHPKQARVRALDPHGTKGIRYLWKPSRGGLTPTPPRGRYTCAAYYHTTIISLPDVDWSMAHGRLPCTDCTRCVPPQLQSNGTATPTVVREPQLHFMPVYQLYR